MFIKICRIFLETKSNIKYKRQYTKILVKSYYYKQSAEIIY